MKPGCSPFSSPNTFPADFPDFEIDHGTTKVITVPKATHCDNLAISVSLIVDGLPTSPSFITFTELANGDA